MKYILASASPRRKELLKKIINDFSIIPSSIDESLYPIDLLSLKKAEEISSSYPEDIVIGADTIVVFNETILGKPKDKNDAFLMLKSLSNNTHMVITYYSICLKNEHIAFTNKVISYVTFNNLSDDLIKEYIETGSPLDKAGAYGIQDNEFNLVKEYSGDINNIIGLPIDSLKRDLFDLGLFPKQK